MIECMHEEIWYEHAEHQQWSTAVEGALQP
jgi:hypothetical protein